MTDKQFDNFVRNHPNSKNNRKFIEAFENNTKVIFFKGSNITFDITTKEEFKIAKIVLNNFGSEISDYILHGDVLRYVEEKKCRLILRLSFDWFDSYICLCPLSSKKVINSGSLLIDIVNDYCIENNNIFVLE